MTYHPDFQKTLRNMPNLVKEKIAGRAVIYAGGFENTAGEINLLNYSHFGTLLE